MDRLTDKEILDAWENAFDKPVYLDHKPTGEELLLIRLRAVLDLFNEEEIRKEVRDEWRQKCADMIAMRHEISTKEERERILTVVDIEYDEDGVPVSYPTQETMQALKEEK